MKASEFPDGFKKEMLRRIRDQIGATEYDKLVSAVGKDGVVDLALEGMRQASKQSSESQSNKRTKEFLETAWDKWGWLAGLILLFEGVPFAERGEGDGLMFIGGLVLVAWIGPRARQWFSLP